MDFTHDHPSIIFLIASSVTAHFENILMIGESLSCGPFGKSLVQQLTQAGNKITLYCAASGTPADWLKGQNPPGQKCQTLQSNQITYSPCKNGTGNMPPLSQLLASHRGSRVIAALGTNSLLSPEVDNSYLTMTKAIKGNGSHWDWIGLDWIGPQHVYPNEAKGSDTAT